MYAYAYSFLMYMHIIYIYLYNSCAHYIICIHAYIIYIMCMNAYIVYIYIYHVLCKCIFYHFSFPLFVKIAFETGVIFQLCDWVWYFTIPFMTSWQFPGLLLLLLTLSCQKRNPYYQWSIGIGSNAYDPILVAVRKLLICNGKSSPTDSFTQMPK